jgi:hypothetical protein
LETLPSFTAMNSPARGTELGLVACARPLSPAAALRLPARVEADLVVQVVLERWLGDDWPEPDPIGRLAPIGRFNTDDPRLVSGPVVAVTERLFERVPIRGVQHDGFAVLEVEDGLLLRFLPLTDNLLRKV